MENGGETAGLISQLDRNLRIGQKISESERATRVSCNDLACWMSFSFIDSEMFPSRARSVIPPVNTNT